jgi:hypothetical protein
MPHYHALHLALFPYAFSSGFFLTLGRNVAQFNYFLHAYNNRCVLTNGRLQLVSITSLASLGG